MCYKSYFLKGHVQTFILEVSMLQKGKTALFLDTTQANSKTAVTRFQYTESQKKAVGYLWNNMPEMEFTHSYFGLLIAIITASATWLECQFSLQAVALLWPIP